MGTTDRLIRLVMALILAGLYFSGTVQGIAAIIISVLALILVFTSFIKFCPLYLPFGVNTCKSK